MSINLVDHHRAIESPAGQSDAVGDTYRQATPDKQTAIDPGDDLSDRERQVLRLVALGHTNAEIAAKLFFSIRTIETHRAHIQIKLGITGRVELVHYALEHDLIGA